MLTWKQYESIPIEFRADRLYTELKKYFLRYIPEEFLDLHPLSPGEVSCFTRYHYKIYFIDNKSVTSDNTEGLVRLTILHIGHTPRFVLEKIQKIIKENRLRKYEVKIRYRDLYLSACVLHHRMPDHISKLFRRNKS